MNWVIDGTRDRYKWSIAKLANIKGIVMILFAISLFMTYWVYTNVPRGFLPQEDQGYFITIVQAPEGVSLNYTEKVLENIEGIMRRKDEKGESAYPEIENIFAVGGFSFSGNTPNNGIVFATLKPWKERSRSADSIIGGMVPQPF